MRYTYCIIMALWAVVLAMGCESDVADIHSLDGTWTLVAYENMLTRVLEPKPNQEGSEVRLTFSDDEKEGTLIGVSGPNRVSGNYRLTPEHELEVMAYGGTKTGEIQWTAKSREVFPLASSYQVARDRMYIYYDGDKERMVFVKN